MHLPTSTVEKMRPIFNRLGLCMALAMAIFCGLMAPQSAFANSVSVENAPWTTFSLQENKTTELTNRSSCRYKSGGKRGAYGIEGHEMSPDHLGKAGMKLKAAFKEAAGADRSAAEREKAFISVIGTDDVKNDFKNMFDYSAIQGDSIDLYKFLTPLRGCVLPVNIDYGIGGLNGIKKLLTNPAGWMTNLAYSLPTMLAKGVYEGVAGLSFKYAFFTPHVERGETFMDIHGCADVKGTQDGKDCDSINKYGFDRSALEEYRTAPTAGYIKLALYLRTVLTNLLLLIITLAGFIFIFRGTAAKTLNVPSLGPRIILMWVLLFWGPGLIGMAITTSNLTTQSLMDSHCNEGVTVATATATMNCQTQGQVNMVLSNIDFSSSPTWTALLGDSAAGIDFGSGADENAQGMMRLFAFTGSAYYMGWLAIASIARQMALMLCVGGLPLAVFALVSERTQKWFGLWVRIVTASLAIPTVMAAIFMALMSFNPLADFEIGGNGMPITSKISQQFTIITGLVMLLATFYLVKKVTMYMYAAATGSQARTWTSKYAGKAGGLLSLAPVPGAAAAGAAVSAYGRGSEKMGEFHSSMLPERNGAATQVRSRISSATGGMATAGMRAAMPHSSSIDYARLGEENMRQVGGQIKGALPAAPGGGMLNNVDHAFAAHARKRSDEGPPLLNRWSIDKGQEGQEALRSLNDDLTKWRMAGNKAEDFGVEHMSDGTLFVHNHQGLSERTINLLSKNGQSLSSFQQDALGNVAQDMATDALTDQIVGSVAATVAPGSEVMLNATQATADISSAVAKANREQSSRPRTEDHHSSVGRDHTTAPSSVSPHRASGDMKHPAMTSAGGVVMPPGYDAQGNPVRGQQPAGSRPMPSQQQQGAHNAPSAPDNGMAPRQANAGAAPARPHGGMAPERPPVKSGSDK